MVDVDVSSYSWYDDKNNNSEDKPFDPPIFAHLKHLDVHNCSNVAQDIFVHSKQLVTLSTTQYCVELLKNQTKLKELDVQLIQMHGDDEDIFDTDPKDFTFKLEKFTYEAMYVSPTHL